MNRELFRAEQLPVFQNRMFRTAQEAMACARGDVVLEKDERTGLVFNRAFRPELMQYDADYQNEQAVSAVFRSHLDEITRVVERHFERQLPARDPQTDRRPIQLHHGGP
jgi:hypothetical protein